MDLKVYCPAWIMCGVTVSQICNFICFPLAWISLDPNSTPMVVSWSNLNFFYRNWRRMHDLPTPAFVTHTYLCPQSRCTWTNTNMNSFLLKLYNPPINSYYLERWIFKSGLCLVVPQLRQNEPASFFQFKRLQREVGVCFWDWPRQLSFAFR